MASEQAKTHTTELFKKMPVFISSSEAIKYCFLFMDDGLEASAKLAEKWNGDFASLASAIRNLKNV